MIYLLFLPLSGGTHTYDLLYRPEGISGTSLVLSESIYLRKSIFNSPLWFRIVMEVFLYLCYSDRFPWNCIAEVCSQRLWSCSMKCNWKFYHTFKAMKLCFILQVLLVAWTLCDVIMNNFEQYTRVHVALPICYTSKHPDPHSSSFRCY
jgi:hypothetical protein